MSSTAYGEFRPARRRWVLAVVAVLVGVLLPTASAQADGGPKLTVMTRNLYLGTGLTNTVTAASFPEFVAAVSQNWANVVASDFPTRAGALAAEIRQTQPDVVGLQEVSLWREQLTSDTVTGTTTPNAEHVVYDFLALLQAELDAAGSPYKAVSTSQNADVEAPRVNSASPNGFTDVRLTDHDVILVRAPLAPKFSNPADGRFATQLTIPSVGGPVTFTRGWTSIDYRQSAHTTVRVFNTHLEVENPPAAGMVQVAQGNELLALIGTSPHPVVALGDFNSAADGSTTPTYGNLTALLTDAWTSGGGNTCCQPELLDTPEPTATSRIDLVVTEGPWRVDRIALTGDAPFRTAPAPLWASDHYGVVARLALSPS